MDVRKFLLEDHSHEVAAPVRRVFYSERDSYGGGDQKEVALHRLPRGSRPHSDVEDRDEAMKSTEKRQRLINVGTYVLYLATRE